jgi:hypothetical protein
VKNSLVSKKEVKPHVLCCSKCGSKTVANLKRVNKTATSFRPCKKCSQKGNTYDIHDTIKEKGKEKKTIHRVVGKITRIGKNSVKIHWFS